MTTELTTWLLTFGLVTANIVYVHTIGRYIQMTNEEVSRIEVLKKEIEQKRQGRTMYQQR